MGPWEMKATLPGPVTSWKKKLARLTDEEKELVEGFYRDVRGGRREKLRSLLDQIWFTAPLLRTVENQAAAGGRAYAYFFTARSGHGGELTTVLCHPEMDEAAADETFAKVIRKMWVQFAETGDPSLPEDISPDGRPKEWPPYDLTGRQVMILDESGIHPEKEAGGKLADRDRTYFLTRHYIF